MSRTFQQPQALAITTDAEGRPAWLRWRGRRERVSVCNAWRVEGAWWRGQPAVRAYYTLLTASRVALVVYHDEASPPEVGWQLERILD